MYDKQQEQPKQNAENLCKFKETQLGSRWQIGGRRHVYLAPNVHIGWVAGSPVTKAHDAARHGGPRCWGAPPTEAPSLASSLGFDWWVLAGGREGTSATEAAPNDCSECREQ